MRLGTMSPREGGLPLYPVQLWTNTTHIRVYEHTADILAILKLTSLPLQKLCCEISVKVRSNNTTVLFSNRYQLYKCSQLLTIFTFQSRFQRFKDAYRLTQVLLYDGKSTRGNPLNVFINITWAVCDWTNNGHDVTGNLSAARFLHTHACFFLLGIYAIVPSSRL